jgi:hypothetical protein
LWKKPITPVKSRTTCDPPIQQQLHDQLQVLAQNQTGSPGSGPTGTEQQKMFRLAFPVASLVKS